MTEYATREDLLYVVMVIAGGFVGACALAILVGIVLRAPGIGSATGAGVLFGMVAYLSNNPRAKRVARTPISKLMQRRA